VSLLNKKEMDENYSSEQHLQDLLGMDFDEFLNELDVAPEASVERKTQSVSPEVSQRKPQQKKERTGWQSGLLTYLHDLVYLLAALILAFLLLFRVVVVSGTSMNNTLLHGDYLLLLSNIFYHDPQYGDVIVASKESFDDGAPIVKRVIATEGQIVDIDFELGVVYVGDSVDTLKPLNEPYTLTPTNVKEGVSFPLTVEEGCLFVMGDNRNGSRDSRDASIGFVDKREVIGKVFFLFLPGTNTESDPRPMDWSRFGWIGGVNG
jgi:signal peptidase I